MFDALNESLEAFLRAEVPLPPTVDVVFGAPDKEWKGRRARPTVNLFLHELRRSSKRSVTGTATSRLPDGTYRRDQLLPFVRASYAISVWASEPADEYRLLGDLLALLVTAGDVPGAYLGTDLAALGNPVELVVAPEDRKSLVELWSSLGVPPRAAVELFVHLPVAPPAGRVVPAPPSDVQLGTSDQNPGSTRRSTVEERPAPGAGEALDLVDALAPEDPTATTPPLDPGPARQRRRPGGATVVEG